MTAEASIAPPPGLPEAPVCPHCRGRRTKIASAFGSQASLATYWCDDCRSPFELLRWRNHVSTSAGTLPEGLPAEAGRDIGRRNHEPASAGTTAQESS